MEDVISDAYDNNIQQIPIFGHIHGACGIEKIDNTTFVNAAILNEHYKLAYKPVLLEI
jgi:Icc-related predicted phosphoesterase